MFSRFLGLTMILAISLPNFLVANELTTAREELATALRLIDSIAPYVERIDTSRLMVLRKNVTMVQDSLTTKGLGNFATMNAYQRLILSFRFSVSFFRQIETETTRAQIIKLNEISKSIDEARGLQEALRFSANLFSEMHQLILQLKKIGTLPRELEVKLDALIAPIGTVISFGQVHGDIPAIATVAGPVQQMIAELYPDFGKITHSNAAFNTVLEIQGLNEIYGEFLRVPR